jgi:hypothetical protein
MRKLFFALFVLCGVLFPGMAQCANLVVNPSFEQQFQGWEPLWCREEGQGKAECLSTSNPGGSHCLKVTYGGMGTGASGRK